MLQVSLDGGATFSDAPMGVVVRQELEYVPGEDESGVLLLNMTHEGVIRDVWVKRGDAEHNIATSSQTYDELTEAMIEADS